MGEEGLDAEIFRRVEYWNDGLLSKFISINIEH